MDELEIHKPTQNNVKYKLKNWTEGIVTQLCVFVYNILDAFKQPFIKILI